MLNRKKNINVFANAMLIIRGLGVNWKGKVAEKKGLSFDGK